MNRAHFVAGCIMFIIAGIFVLGAVQLPIGSMMSPEAGFVPLIQTLILMLAAAWLILCSIFQATKWEGTVWPTGNAKRMVLHVSIALISYVALMGAIGFLVSTLLFMFGAGYAWRRYSPLILLASSTAISLSLYLVFGEFLQMPLPRNALGLP